MLLTKPYPFIEGLSSKSWDRGQGNEDASQGCCCRSKIPIGLTFNSSSTPASKNRVASSFAVAPFATQHHNHHLRRILSVFPWTCNTPTTSTFSLGTNKSCLNKAAIRRSYHLPGIITVAQLPANTVHIAHSNCHFPTFTTRYLDPVSCPTWRP